ncbi:MAG TPA: NAD(P)-dependent oxidoreductase [Candidatus Sulfotelmatobacter sp.]|nr:NAD(P)-dependent oxidoreductase [Candidatus Sulfotelmatobacter sp.]
MQTKTRIGFIGLGIMGSRMAANLQKHGYPLVVFNRTQQKAETLVSAGAEWAATPAALAGRAEIILTMLAHPDAVEGAAMGKDGFLAQASPGRLWVDCSTVNPSFTRKMAAQAQARGVRFMDAPVTGSKSAAEQGKLIIWAGGAAGDLETVRPMLECIGSKVVHCGDVGMGASMKMVMNQLLGTAMAAFAEGLILGESLGLSRKLVLDSILGSPLAAPFLAAKRERIEDGKFTPADFPLRWLHKDMHLAAVSAYETGVAMPLTNDAKEMYQLAIREGHGEADFSAVYSLLASNH